MIKPAKRSKPTVAITPARVAELSNVFTPADIAEILKIPQSEVEDMLKRAGRGKDSWTVRCNRTGKTWQTRSKRAAYRLVCLLGLTDWDWEKA